MDTLSETNHFLVNMSKVAGGVEADAAAFFLLEVNIRLPLVQPDTDSFQLSL